ncbi:MAG: mannose-6-phosphate isomerase-like protein (cupin superfamily) [Mariniblastus sp.]|jgi:mannose-6-phosphate isomerase-like protein (cupin superfamily)
MEKINLSEKFAKFNDPWAPKIVAELNGQHVKLAKLQGEFVWHHHDDEDELFFVIKGELLVHFRDRIEVVGAGEMLVIPRGVEHKPEAKEEVHLMMFEPATTVNTGAAGGSRTVEFPEWI